MKEDLIKLLDIIQRKMDNCVDDYFNRLLSKDEFKFMHSCYLDCYCLIMSFLERADSNED